MKLHNLPFLFLLVFAGCTSQKNTNEFIQTTSGRYLFNANEVLEIYFQDQLLYVKWRGNDQISPLKINDSTFYMKELNEKMIFVRLPQPHIELAPKREHKDVKYHFRKMLPDEKTPSEYLTHKEYDKALIAYRTIQQNDSLNPVIREGNLNNLGYDFLRQNDVNTAIEVFTINTILYPNSSNTFDSLAEAYLKGKDTVNAIVNFKKALAINPENRSSKKGLEKLTPY
ncbi:hypothetical protein [Polaribacter sp. HL-MS24]|uniref:tetratricopeptide repeat protein n=1 Tax=Polaribacter sp. HL-MS24 TaxID=3077735 RepID=UPI00293513A3|nr:hypothetical protein [Polaribacter sp. HL-MS24]WOC40523.1 hypothetical protein RRF69_01605 [Polaribacter sp. HL-MS24]